MSPLLLLLLLLLACGPGADSGFTPLDLSFAFTITVTESRAPGGGSPAAWATVSNRDGEAPPWELELAAGDCGFYGVRPLQDCDPTCETGTVCTWDGACVEPSPAIDAGVITVQGLAVDLALTPSSEWVYYGYDFEPEPSEGEIFGQGDPLVARAAGADLAPFELSTLGVAPLDSDLPCPLETDEDLTVTWTPGQEGDRVVFRLASANHGNQFPAVICETQDDGALVVDGALLRAWRDESLPVRSWWLQRVHEARDAVSGVAVVFEAQAVEGCTWY